MFQVLRRPPRLASAVATLVLLLFTLSIASAEAATPAKIRHGPRSVTSVALTFDDCYRTADIQAIVAILRKKHAAATFFCTGKAIANAPSVFADLSSSFTLANHSWSHPNLSTLSPAQITSQMTRTKQEIGSVSGATPTDLMRPPYGYANEATRAVLGELGYRIITWDIDTRDWTGIDATAIKAHALKAVNGSIVLMHDATNSVAALPGVIDGLRNKGFRLVSVDDLLD